MMAMEVSLSPSDFRTFWDRGYRRLVPIIPPGAPLSQRSTMAKRLAAGKDPRGKVPGIQGDDGLWHGFDWINCEADENLITLWSAMGAGIGIKTGDQGDGTSLVAIDADTLDRGLANLIYRAIVTTFSAFPPVRIGRPPKALYPIRVAGTVPYTFLPFGTNTPKERVELLADGKQFVAAGVHPVTGKPYEWRQELPAYKDMIVHSGGLL